MLSSLIRTLSIHVHACPGDRTKVNLDHGY